MYGGPARCARRARKEAPAPDPGAEVLHEPRGELLDGVVGEPAREAEGERRAERRRDDRHRRAERGAEEQARAPASSGPGNARTVRPALTTMKTSGPDAPKPSTQSRTRSADSGPLGATHDEGAEMSSASAAQPRSSLHARAAPAKNSASARPSSVTGASP